MPLPPPLLLPCLLAASTFLSIHPLPSTPLQGSRAGDDACPLSSPSSFSPPDCGTESYCCPPSLSCPLCSVALPFLSPVAAVQTVLLLLPLPMQPPLPPLWSLVLWSLVLSPSPPPPSAIALSSDEELQCSFLDASVYHACSGTLALSPIARPAASDAPSRLAPWELNVRARRRGASENERRRDGSKGDESESEGAAGGGTTVAGAAVVAAAAAAAAEALTAGA